MDDMMRMQVIDTVEDAQHDLSRSFLGETNDLGQVIEQFAVRTQFHDDEDVVWSLERSDDVDDVRMATDQFQDPNLSQSGIAFVRTVVVELHDLAGVLLSRAFLDALSDHGTKTFAQHFFRLVFLVELSS